MSDRLFNWVCDDVCRRLPIGWQLEIQLELDCGDVELIDPNGNARDFPSNRETLSDTVFDAIDFAVAESSERGAKP